jgi:poly-gamma-glutamate synthesis protein (capsule biosynthesis protein)
VKLLSTLLFFLVAAVPAYSQAEPPKQQAPDLPQKEPLRIRITFAGDVLMEADWRKPAPPPAELFADVREILSAADLAIVNLESPLTEWPHQTRFKSKALVAAGRDYILRVTSQEAAPALRDAGIDVVALANNHTMDYGERGISETMERLRDAGVLYAGAGANRAEAERARVIEVKGIRIGVLSFSDVVPPGYAAFEDWPGIASAKDVSRMENAIRAAHKDADFVLVVFHWGEELARMPTKRQMDLARAARDAGAGLILGAHPHVLEPVGCMGNVPVVYSAGNFVFPTGRPLAQRSAIFEIEITRESESAAASASAVRILPMVMNEEGRVRPAEPAVAAEILREMETGAAQLGARLDAAVLTCTGQPVRYVPRRETPRKPSPAQHKAGSKKRN